MSQEFNSDIELDSDLIDFDEFYPDEAWDALAKAEYLSKNINQDTVSETSDVLEQVTNDEFLTAIFGYSFSTEHPLVCHKAGDPDQGGWRAVCWPCNTNQPDLNWYF